MALDNKKQPVDRWLDAAIKQYGDMEPDSGLEQRILRSLNTQPAKNMLWQRWLVFATAAAVVLIAGGVWIHKAQHNPERIAVIPHPQIKTIEAPSATPAISATVSANPTKKKVQHYASVTEAAAQSRPAQFPSPQPLSDQEKLLAQYVQDRPKEAGLVARARAELLQRDMMEFEKQGRNPKINDTNN